MPNPDTARLIRAALAAAAHLHGRNCQGNGCPVISTRTSPRACDEAVHELIVTATLYLSSERSAAMGERGAA